MIRCWCASCLAPPPDQAADDQVKIKITKYKTGSTPGGQVKVQEMGEGDPQWQHIKDVVKEQLEKAGLKAEGTRAPRRVSVLLYSFLLLLLLRSPKQTFSGFLARAARVVTCKLKSMRV